MTGTELTRIPIPCRRDRYTETQGPDAWWPTPEPPHRINQIYLEPHAVRPCRGAARRARCSTATQVTGFTQDADGVTVPG